MGKDSFCKYGCCAFPGAMYTLLFACDAGHKLSIILIYTFLPFAHLYKYLDL